MKCPSLLVAMLFITATVSLHAQAPTEYAFHHQGMLEVGDAYAHGQYDLGFQLYVDPALGPGNECSGAISHEDVEIDNGLYSVLLDFGDVFSDLTCRWLRISVKESASGDPAEYLTPATYISTVPYASFSKYADTAGTSQNALHCEYLDSGGYTMEMASVYCASDFLVTGGGCVSSSPESIMRSYPVSTGESSSWHCQTENASSLVKTFAVCCKIGDP